MFAKARVFFANLPPDLRARIWRVYAVVALLNLGGWIWALMAFRGLPALLGVALVVYALGLRHAVDADHIAAIDNVTRKLMQEGQRPVAVGFFFALGHSAVIMICVAGLILAAAELEGYAAWKAYGGLIETCVSAAFLFAVAAMNVAIFRGALRDYRHLRAGRPARPGEDGEGRGASWLGRALRPIFALVARSWQMSLVGFLFGLGFDTTTEVAVFAISAAQSAKGLPFHAIAVFPVLFAAGMILVDTTDGVMMLGAYQWALLNPTRKIFYNMTITLVSIAAAVLIGGLETLGLVGERLGLEGSFWTKVGALNENFNAIGFAFIALFAVAWAISYALSRVRGATA